MRVAEAWSARHGTFRTSVDLRPSDERNAVSKYQSIKGPKYKMQDVGSLSKYSLYLL
jgi:hypothetical protein